MYQIILLGDRGTQYVAFPMPLRNGAQPGVEPTTCKSQVRCPINSTTKANNYQKFAIICFHPHSLQVWRMCDLVSQTLSVMWPKLQFLKDVYRDIHIDVL